MKLIRLNIFFGFPFYPLWLLVSFLKGSADVDNGRHIPAWTPYSWETRQRGRLGTPPPHVPIGSYTTSSFGCAELPQAVGLTICLRSAVTCSLCYITRPLRLRCVITKRLSLFAVTFVSPLVVSCLCAPVIPTHDRFILHLTADSFLAAASLSLCFFLFHLPPSLVSFFSVSICHSVRVLLGSQRKPYGRKENFFFPSANTSASIKRCPAVL